MCRAVLCRTLKRVQTLTMGTSDRNLLARACELGAAMQASNGAPVAALPVRACVRACERCLLACAQAQRRVRAQARVRMHDAMLCTSGTRAGGL